MSFKEFQKFCSLALEHCTNCFKMVLSVYPQNVVTHSTVEILIICTK